MANFIAKTKSDEFIFGQGYLEQYDRKLFMDDWGCTLCSTAEQVHFKIPRKDYCPPLPALAKEL